MTKSRPEIHARYRSLLQKAVRRGHVELVLTTSALLASLGPQEKNWFRTRTAAITFEESWPLGTQLIFNKKFHSKVAALIKVTRSQKARDATGLGYMAYALSEGDTSVFNATSADRTLKIMANAIQRPDNFWTWIASQPKSEQQERLIGKARYFKNDGLPRDKTVLQSAAYLALTEKIPDPNQLPATDDIFPFWIAFDRHTPEGMNAFRDIARDLHIPLPQLEWVCFYFEGALANAAMTSKWWDRYCAWRFQKIGLAAEEAHLLWEPVKKQVMEALSDDSRKLQKDLYRWKLSNREQIDALKRQVDLFNIHFEEIQRDQSNLF